jgi:fatty-acyl-CoA synthase
MVTTHEPLFFSAGLLGAMWLGAVPVSCAPPALLQSETAWAAHFGAIAAEARVRIILTDDAILPLLLHIALPAQCLGIFDIAEWLAECEADASTSPSRYPAGFANKRALVQFTSGSTGTPKGVSISSSSLVANLSALVEALDITPLDSTFTWLPLHHDMGLIGGLLLALWTGIDLALSRPTDFLQDSLGWLDIVDLERATATMLPNFALARTAGKLQLADATREWDLSGLRLLICGGERINPEVVEGFFAATKRYGLKPTSFRAAYGAAEATLAMTISRTEGCRTEQIPPASDRGLTALSIPSGGRVISCGAVLPGHAIEIVDDSGALLPERMVGHIRFRGPSVATAYRTESTGAKLQAQSNSLETGDRGFLSDGELYVVGRISDVIIINGRNVYPEPLEWTVGEVEGVRSGCVAAVPLATPASEALAIIAEVRSDRPSIVTDAITTRVLSEYGLTVARVVLVPPRSLPKTSSGKIQRRLAAATFIGSPDPT